MESITQDIQKECSEIEKDTAFTNKKVKGENRMTVRECYEKIGANYDGVLSDLEMKC